MDLNASQQGIVATHELGALFEAFGLPYDPGMSFPWTHKFDVPPDGRAREAYTRRQTRRRVLHVGRHTVHFTDAGPGEGHQWQYVIEDLT